MINITAPLNTNSGPGDHLNGRIPLTLDVPDYLYYDYVGDGQYYSPKASATIGSSESDIIFKRQGYR